MPVRQYFHSRTCLPMQPEELDHDSDDDVDDSWILSVREKLLDDFDDVSLEEKTFMKLWNRHTRCFRTIADSQIPLSCEVFARRFAPR
ncbi:unnamed protein product [Phaeothamnion confervicola]